MSLEALEDFGRGLRFQWLCILCIISARRLTSYRRTETSRQYSHESSLGAWLAINELDDALDEVYGGLGGTPLFSHCTYDGSVSTLRSGFVASVRPLAIRKDAGK